MIYMFLADGFEEVEALCPLDLLRRAGLEVTTVGVGGKQIRGSHGIAVEADVTDGEFSDNAPDMIILPGGMPGTLNLGNSPVVLEAVHAAATNGAYLATICAAPSILGDLGYLSGKEAICYPGFEDRLRGATISQNRVVRDGCVITAAGMGVALDFGLELVSVLACPEKAEELRHAVLAD